MLFARIVFDSRRADHPASLSSRISAHIEIARCPLVTLRKSRKAVMKLGADTQSGHRSRARDAKRNFILQQGLSEPVAESCPLQYSALLFQPRVIGLWFVMAVIMQKPSWFFALASVLWWSALAPRLNPFDALYNWTFARGTALTSAPAPRRFAQFLAGSFSLAIGILLDWSWRITA